MDYNINNIYEYYIKNYEDNIEKSLFRKICEEFNIEIMELILSGKSFDMGNNLSSLSISRIERDPRSPRIDWGESNK